MLAPPAQIGRHAAQAPPRERHLRTGVLAERGAVLPHVVRKLGSPVSPGAGRQSPGVQPDPALDQVGGVHAGVASGAGAPAPARRSASTRLAPAPVIAYSRRRGRPSPRADIRSSHSADQQPPLGKPAKRLVEGAVRGQAMGAAFAGEELREREPVQRVAPRGRNFEDGALDRDQAVLAAAHHDSIAPDTEFDYIFPLMATPPSGRSADLRLLAWELLVAVGAGSITGAVIGGVGGRLTMFVLRLGSHPELMGVQTDDGFEIGRFTTSTVFLLMVTAGLGGAVGAIYLVFRGALRRRGGLAIWAAAVGLYTGADLLKPGKFDFIALEPKLFAVAAFVLMPLIGAVAIPVVIERLLPLQPTEHRRLFALLACAVIPLIPVAPVLGVLAGVMLLVRRRPSLAAYSYTLGRVAVPIALLAVTVWSANEVARDAASILSQ